MHIAAANPDGVNGDLYIVGTHLVREINVPERQFTFAFQY
jgi:hypothetical protein